MKLPSKFKISKVVEISITNYENEIEKADTTLKQINLMSRLMPRLFLDMKLALQKAMVEMKRDERKRELKAAEAAKKELEEAKNETPVEIEFTPSETKKVGDNQPENKLLNLFRKKDK